MNEKLKFTEKLGFGLGEVAGCMNSLIAAFLTMFYTDSMLMAAGAVGTMFFVSKLFDGITDLIAGTMVDNTRTKWGKARPWLLWGSIPTGLALALIFLMPEHFSATGKMIYAFITYNFFTSVMYTIVGVAKAALMPRMTYDGQQRGQLAIFSLIFGLGGTILLMSLTFPLMFRFGGGVTGWRIAFGIYGAITTLALIFSFLLTREKVGENVSQDSTKQSGVKFTDGLKLFFTNKYFLIAAAITILVNFQTNINSSGQVYFYTYNMNNPMLTSSLSMVGLIPTVISIVFLSGPSLRFLGKKKSIYVGAGVMIVGYAIRAAAGAIANVPMLIVGTVICSLATGPISVPVNVLSADAVDYGDYTQKTRIEGIGSSVVSFAQKISSGLAAGAVGWILQLTGYVANQTQTATASFGITLIFAYAPMIALVLAILILFIFYRYDKIEPEVRSYLEHKNSKEANPA